MGFALVGLLVLLLIVSLVFDLEILPEHKETVKSVYLRLLILGLLLIALSKEKVEDERTYLRKVKSMARSLVYILFFIMIRPISAVFSDETYLPLSEELVIISMLFFQIGMFYFEKYNEKASEK